MTRVRIALGGLVVAALVQAGCFLVDSFSGYDTDGGADATPDGPGSRDATVDGIAREASTDAKVECGSPSDPMNCGRCGHDCFGGGCAAGACLPVMIASQLTNPQGLAVTEAGVYYAEGTPTGRVFLWDPETRDAMVVASNQNMPTWIAASQGLVYWSSQTGLQTCPVGKSSCSPTPLAAAGTGPIDLVAAGENHVCWGAVDAGVVSCLPLEGASGSMTQHAGQKGLSGIFVSAENVWFTGGVDAGDGGYVARAVLDQMKLDLVIPELYSPERVIYLTSDGGTTAPMVFWSENVAPDGGLLGGVFECDPGGICSPPPLATADLPVGIAVDQTYVFFVSSSSSGGRVYSCPLSDLASDAGCRPTTLTTAQSRPLNLAQDTTSLYWTNDAKDGGVMRLAKPVE